jgi:two-component system, sensor histidine kinase and response regulator
MTKILVIEDEDRLRDNIAQILEFGDFEVDTASNGITGVELARNAIPDLIVCDIMMKQLDGFGVLQELRGDPSTANIPFIFVTAKADRDTMRQGMTLGADDYVTKPFTTSELLDAVQSRLQRHTSIRKEAEKQLEQTKQQLSRMVAHELRTPLVSINAVLDIITRQLDYLQPEQMQELLSTIGSGSKRLNRVVEQMVLLTQLETGVINQETLQQSGVPTPMWEIMLPTTNLARRIAQNNADVDLHVDEHNKDATVICHPTALKQALAEVIANAITFSPQGGAVKITQWEADGAVWISVEDHGQGIEPAALEQAIQGFQQVNRQGQEQQGMGVGLMLAKRVIETHGGRLDIQSTVGRGTQVYVGLPLAAN